MDYVWWRGKKEMLKCSRPSLYLSYYVVYRAVPLFSYLQQFRFFFIPSSLLFYFFIFFPLFFIIYLLSTHCVSPRDDHPSRHYFSLVCATMHALVSSYVRNTTLCAQWGLPRSFTFHSPHRLTRCARKRRNWAPEFRVMTESASKWHKSVPARIARFTGRQPNGGR